MAATAPPPAPSVPRGRGDFTAAASVPRPFPAVPRSSRAGQGQWGRCARFCGTAGGSGGLLDVSLPIEGDHEGQRRGSGTGNYPDDALHLAPWLIISKRRKFSWGW